MPFLAFGWLLVSVLMQNAAPSSVQAPVPSAAASAPASLNWKAVLVAGDDSIPAFDNARRTLKGLLLEAGVSADNIRELSNNPSEQVGAVLPGSASDLREALDSLNVGDGDACLVDMTSHGSRQGFFLKNHPALTPMALNAIMERGCGSQPTVLLISACYSGVFVHPEMLKPNRIILTAARDDLTSFGCSVENQYTNWDGCLIEHLPKAGDWQSLYDAVGQCIHTEETHGGFRASRPQGFFGNLVADLKMPAATRPGLAAGTSQCPVSDDDNYGFLPAHAIKVGLDGATGPARELEYLSALGGPTGQRISFRRVGSIVSADQTILDLYELTYPGLEKPVRVYIDEYHFEEPKAPKGLVCSAEIGFKK